MAESIYDELKKRRHPDIIDKLEIWTLIYDSYIGGEQYRKGNYLFKHPKEGTNSYNERQKRAVSGSQSTPGPCLQGKKKA